MQSVQQAMVLQAMLLRHSLFLGSAALVVAGIGVDDKQRLVRKESEQLAFGLNARGQLVDAGRHVHTESSPDVPEQSTLKLGEAGNDKPKLAAVKRVKGAADAETGDLCAKSYLYGNPNTNNCSSHHLGGVSVNSVSMCDDAAEKLGFPAGLPDQGFPFMLTDHFFEVYPRNCFKKEDQKVLWFNPYGTWPELPVGLPVCHRPKYKIGNPSTNGGGCTGEYEKITTVDECRTYAGCTSHCTTDHFRIGIVIPIEKGWYLGDVGESCSDTCSGLPGLLCDAISVEKMTDITDSNKFTAEVKNSAHCSNYASSALRNGDFPSVDTAGGKCTAYDATNTTGFAPTCDAKPASVGVKRFCYCQYDEQYQIPEGTGPEYYDVRPSGCFMHHETNCIFFNVPRTATPTGPIEGTPICAIKTHGQSAQEAASHR